MCLYLCSNAKRPSCFYPITQAADCISRVVGKANTPVIWLSTDAAEVKPVCLSHWLRWMGGLCPWWLGLLVIRLRNGMPSCTATTVMQRPRWELVASSPSIPFFSADSVEWSIQRYVLKPSNLWELMISQLAQLFLNNLDWSIVQLVSNSNNSENMLFSF